MKINLLEHFHSIQGEGSFVGYPAYFFRFPGCNVLYKGHCRDWNGHEWICDTKQAKRALTSINTETLPSIWEKYVVITGGEPMIPTTLRQIEHLIKVLPPHTAVLIETNGTLAIPDWVFEKCYVACSPKLNYLPEQIPRYNEIRLPIYDIVEPEIIPPEIQLHPNVFLSPVNHIISHRKDTLQYCIEALKFFPNWRLSVQVHKYLGVR